MINNARVKLLSVEVVSGTGEESTVLDNAFTIACAARAIRVVKLQREGKGPMDAETFLRGFPVAEGTTLR